MRTLCFLSALLAVAVPVSAQLCAPTAYQLEDYDDWLGRLDPSANIITPSLQIPASTPIYKYGIRAWTTWEPINSPFFPGDWDAGAFIHTEIVFIGQTGDNWGRFGYRRPGETVVLSETAGDREFGSNFTTVFHAPVFPEFFVETQDGTPYDETHPSARWYYGELQPISSKHDEYPDMSLDIMAPYHVFAIELPSENPELAPSLFVFGVNAFDQNNMPIPEPGTCGIVGAAALLALVAQRRFRAAHRNVAAT